MTPLKRSNNIAARMGRWSARHWKTATFGWLAFVVIAFLLGGQIGTVQLTEAEDLTGQSAKAENLRSPYADGNAGQISKDGRSALVQFDVKGESEDAADRVEPLLDAVAAVREAHPGFIVEEYGFASSMKALDDTVGRDFQRAEILSIPLTLGILIVAFGALLAAFLPLVLALTAFAAALGLLAFAS